MDRYHWSFKKNGGTGNADNIAGKLFYSDYTPLVRESIQNSLDAAVSDKTPVIVTYRFGKLEISAQSPFLELEKWVDGGMEKFPEPEKRIYKNLKSIKDSLSDIKQKGYLCFLEVSDENTIGMDYTSDKRLQSKTKFYSFLKSLGNSSKGGSTTSAGSHGTGKVVFQKLSNLNTIFVSSKEIETGLVLFEGLSELCTSLIGDEEYEYRGYFCLDDTQEPTTSQENIPTQFRRSTIGTSVFVMGVDDDSEKQIDCYEKIKRAIASHFWLSILHKRLVVNVGNETIDDSNIIDIASNIFTETDEDSPIPYIETVYYAENENIDGYIKRENDVPNLGKCILYIRKDRRGANVTLNMRKTEMLIYPQPMLKGYGYYGVFVCQGDEGNKILRMAEDPAHRIWNSNNCENDSDKTKARRAIEEKNKFIKQSIIDSFGGQNENTSSISDLQNYLYMTVSEQELEETRNAVYGIHSGEKQLMESNQKIPDLFADDPSVNSFDQSNEANVYYVEDGITATQDDDNGELEGNRGGEGGGGDIPIIEPSHKHKYNRDSDGDEKGTFFCPLRLSACAVYTKITNGILYHFVRMISNSDCEKMAIDVFAVGDEEDSNDEIFVVEANPGVLEGNNRITGLSCKKGERLEIKVRFEDNMSHPVSIMAYEITQI